VKPLRHTEKSAAELPIELPNCKARQHNIMQQISASEEVDRTIAMVSSASIFP